MTLPHVDPWQARSPSPVEALVLGAVRRTRVLWAGLRVDHGTLLALLHTLFLVDARGGRFVQLNFNPSVIWTLAPLLFFVLGLVTGIGALGGELAPMQWMATVQFVGAMALAGPILFRDVTRLLDDPDRAVLDGRPVSTRTRAAARSLHVLVRHLPNAICFIAGPMLLGSMLHGPLVLLVAPLATLASLVVLLTLLPACWSLLSLVLGLRVLRRVSAIGEVAALSLLLGSFGLVSPLVLPLIETLARTIADIPPTAYLLPPVQWGGLFALVLGEVSRTTITLSVLAVITPLACTQLYYSLARRGTADRSPAADTEIWPISRLAGLIAKVPEERAGFGLASALYTRDAKILKRVWPMTIGMPVFLIIGAVRSAPAVGAYGHWMPLLLWPGIPAVMLLGLGGVNISAHANGAGVFRQLPLLSRDRALTGAIRGAFLTLVLPISLGLLLVTWRFLGPRATLDTLVFLELGFVLVVEQKIRLLSPIPFSEFDFSDGARREQHGIEAQGRMPAKNKVGPAAFLAVMGGSTVVLALLHLNFYLMIAASIVMLLPMLRAWRRLDLLRTVT